MLQPRNIALSRSFPCEKPEAFFLDEKPEASFLVIFLDLALTCRSGSTQDTLMKAEEYSVTVSSFSSLLLLLDSTKEKRRSSSSGMMVAPPGFCSAEAALAERAYYLLLYS